MWQPSHAVPASGLPLWDEPDANREPVHRVDPWVDVRLVEQRGNWGLVVFDNGFSGWVDAAQLVPVDPQAGLPALPIATTVRATRSGTWIAVALVAAVVIAGGAVLLTRDDDDDAVGDGTATTITSGTLVATTGVSTATTTTSVTTSTAEVAANGVARVALHVPAGWTLSGDGLVAVENPADLAAAVPAGPVVRARVGVPDETDFEGAMDAALAEAGSGTAFEFSSPERREVDGFPAVAITVRGNGRVQVLVTVHPPGADSVMFVLDVPADRVDELSGVLASVPGFAVRAG